MLKGVERGCLVIADISGYTGFLAATELDHAQDALRDLFQTVVGRLRPQLRLAKLEGDAAFSYAVAERIDGSIVLDTLEAFVLRLIEHRERYDDVGELRAWVHDLDRAWARERELRRVVISERETLSALEVELPAAPALAWEYVTAPAHRARWILGVVRVDEELVAGRRGIGTTNHCVHGDGASVEEIVDWRPFDYFTMRSTVPGLISFVTMSEFESSEGGTRLRVRIQRPKGGKERAMFDRFGEELIGIYRASLEALRRLLTSETKAEATAVTPTSVG